MASKSPDAFRTISEVADWLNTPAHVLRFWESKFSQVKPVKRAGGRRYYRPADMALIGGIKKLLHDDGMTIKGVQKMLREQGIKHVAAMSDPVDEDLEQFIDPVTTRPAPVVPSVPETGQVLSFDSRRAEPEDNTPEADLSHDPLPETRKADTPPPADAVPPGLFDEIDDGDDNLFAEGEDIAESPYHEDHIEPDESAPEVVETLADPVSEREEPAPEPVSEPETASKQEVLTSEAVEPESIDPASVEAETGESEAGEPEHVDPVVADTVAPEPVEPESVEPQTKIDPEPAAQEDALPSFLTRPLSPPAAPQTPEPVAEEPDTPAPAPDPAPAEPAFASRQPAAQTQPESPAPVALKPKIVQTPPDPLDHAVMAEPGLMTRLAQLEPSSEIDAAALAPLRERLSGLHEKMSDAARS